MAKRMDRKRNKASLYLHIPFCRHICGYCDFDKLSYSHSRARDYLSALFGEIRGFGQERYPTIYVGGGTPTALDEEELKSLVSFLSPLLEEGGEFTVECSPDTVEEGKIALLSHYGVNRLSMGAESFDPRLLKLMGRHHQREDVEKAVSLFRKYGIEDFSLDLIYGFPFESPDDFIADLKTLMQLDPPHVSCYSLTVSQGTPFYQKGIREADEAILAECYERMLGLLRSYGYERYEVSNFAKPGHRCRHNLAYWKDEPYFGAGLGAGGYIDGRHYTNSKSLSDYLNGNKGKATEDIPSLQERLEYYLLTNLRLEEGISKKEFEERFKGKLGQLEPRLALLEKQGLVKSFKDVLALTDKGMLLLDSVLLELIA